MNQPLGESVVPNNAGGKIPEGSTGLVLDGWVNRGGPFDGIGWPGLSPGGPAVPDSGFGWPGLLLVNSLGSGVPVSVSGWPGLLLVNSIGGTVEAFFSASGLLPQ